MLSALRLPERGFDGSTLSASGHGWIREQRVGARTTRVLRIARLSGKCGESLGIIRNISDHGMMLEIHEDFELGNYLAVDLGDGAPMIGEVRWRAGTSAGLHFPQPLDCARILGKPLAAPKGRIARLPRVRTAHAAEIQLARGRIKVEVSDISVGGARIRCDDWLEPGEQVSLLVPGLDAIPAAVRWQAEGSAGIAFHKPASIHALMAWLGGAGMALAAAPATGTNPPQLEPVAVTELRRDPLTGLHDRQGFLDKLEETLLRRGNSRSMVLAVIDIDGFKALNDVNGHETGDAVLVEAGRRLATAAGDQALLARLGSDEFALLLSCAKVAEDALSIVRSAFAEAFCTPSGSHAVSACIGTAAFPRDAKSGEQLICRADIALGAAKQAGGNRVEHFDREMLDS